MQVKTEYTVKKIGRGDGSGGTPGRTIKVPTALWKRAGELGLDRSAVCRAALISEVERLERTK